MPTFVAFASKATRPNSSLEPTGCAGGSESKPLGEQPIPHCT
jgi:hypothetical protein